MKMESCLGQGHFTIYNKWMDVLIIVVLSTKKNHCLNRVRGKERENQRLSTVEATSQYE